MGTIRLCQHAAPDGRPCILRPHSEAVAHWLAPRTTAYGVLVYKTRFARTVSPSDPGGPGRRECWGARTADGVWDFEREDDTRTDWLIYHNPSVADGTWTTPVVICGSLRRCAQHVARGWAAAQLERDKAARGSEAS